MNLSQSCQNKALFFGLCVPAIASFFANIKMKILVILRLRRNNTDTAVSFHVC